MNTFDNNSQIPLTLRQNISSIPSKGSVSAKNINKEDSDNTSEKLFTIFNNEKTDIKKLIGPGDVPQNNN